METMVLGKRKNLSGKNWQSRGRGPQGVCQGKNPMAIRRACVDPVFGENSEPSCTSASQLAFSDSAHQKIVHGECKIQYRMYYKNAVQIIFLVAPPQGHGQTCGQGKTDHRCEFR